VGYTSPIEQRRECGTYTGTDKGIEAAFNVVKGLGYGVGPASLAAL